MKDINRYCRGVRKKTERLLKKMFGYKTVAEGLTTMSALRRWMESSTGKNIDEFDMNDVRKNCCLYSKYRTLNKILSIYVDLVSLDNFMEDFENEH